MAKKGGLAGEFPRLPIENLSPPIAIKSLIVRRPVSFTNSVRLDIFYHWQLHHLDGFVSPPCPSLLDVSCLVLFTFSQR